MAQYLFLDTDIQVLVDATKRDLLEQIDRLSDSAILFRSNEEWLKDLIDNNTIQVPTLDISKADRTFVDALVPQYQVPNPNFDNQHGVLGRIHTLHIPYSGSCRSTSTTRRRADPWRSCCGPARRRAATRCAPICAAWYGISARVGTRRALRSVAMGTMPGRRQ